MPVMQEILKPSFVTKIVSRIRTPGAVLSNFFGVNIGGRNVEQVKLPTPQYTYDIFDKTRKVARGRFRGAPAGSIAPNSVGNNTVTIGRFAQKLPMDYTTIASIRALGENAGVTDRMGKRYIEKQSEYANQHHSNLREFVIGSLLRGGVYYLHASGDDLIPSYTSSGALFTNDLLVPASNELIAGSFAAGLAMDTGSNTITATWATITNDIPLMLQRVSAGFERQVGEPLRYVVCNHTVWNNVISNTPVRQLAGTSSSPWASWDRDTLKAPDGTPLGVQVARIKGLDWIGWLITDHGLDIYDGSSETFTKIVPDDYCLFTTDISDWLMGIEGTEIVKQNDMAAPEEATGMFGWIMEKADPARFELHSVQNFALELNRPKALAVARVQ